MSWLMWLSHGRFWKFPLVKCRCALDLFGFDSLGPYKHRWSVIYWSNELLDNSPFYFHNNYSTISQHTSLICPNNIALFQYGKMVSSLFSIIQLVLKNHSALIIIDKKCTAHFIDFLWSNCCTYSSIWLRTCLVKHFTIHEYMNRWCLLIWHFNSLQKLSFRFITWF
jgi:hypothetical protein